MARRFVNHDDPQRKRISGAFLRAWQAHLPARRIEPLMADEWLDNERASVVAEEKPDRVCVLEVSHSDQKVQVVFLLTPMAAMQLAQPLLKSAIMDVRERFPEARTWDIWAYLPTRAVAFLWQSVFPGSVVARVEVSSGEFRWRISLPSVEEAYQVVQTWP